MVCIIYTCFYQYLPMNQVSAIYSWGIVIIVWVLLLGVHYLDMLLQLKLPPHVPNQNKLCFLLLGCYCGNRYLRSDLLPSSEVFT